MGDCRYFIFCIAKRVYFPLLLLVVVWGAQEPALWLEEEHSRPYNTSGWERHASFQQWLKPGMECTISTMGCNASADYSKHKYNETGERCRHLHVWSCSLHSTAGGLQDIISHQSRCQTLVEIKLLDNYYLYLKECITFRCQLRSGHLQSTSSILHMRLEKIHTEVIFQMCSRVLSLAKCIG